MLRGFDKVITKASINMRNDNSQQIRKYDQVPSNVKDIKRTSFLKQTIKIQEKIPRQLTKNQKLAARFIKNTIQQKLKKYFRKMLLKTIIKKIAYKLVSSKCKRDLQSGFLGIKKMVIQSQRTKLETLRQSYPEIKILERLSKKIENKNKIVAFETIKNQNQRLSMLSTLAKLIFQTLERNVTKQYFNQFFTNLKLIDIKHSEKTIIAQYMIKIFQTKIIKENQQAFYKLLDDALCRECSIVANSKQNKQAEMNNFTVNRKQTLAELREKIKTMKVNFEQQKLARNKVFQEKKKYNNGSKLQLEANQKKFAKQQKAQEEITNEIQLQFDEQERIIGIRNDIRSKSVDSESRCDLIYKTLQREEVDQVKSIIKYIPNLKNEINQFEQSEVNFFKNNLKMQKLIQVHEKRDPYNYEAEYYQLQYENNVLRETIRCFMNARYASLPKYEPKATPNQSSNLESEYKSTI